MTPEIPPINIPIAENKMNIIGRSAIIPKPIFPAFAGSQILKR